MRIWLLVILAVAGILIRVLGFLPWGRDKSQQSNVVGTRFLAAVGLVSLTLIFVWFWFVMKPR
jgi:hypothetical protein